MGYFAYERRLDLYGQWRVWIKIPIESMVEPWYNHGMKQTDIITVKGSQPMKPISYLEARLLKSSGKRIDVKVTVEVTPEKKVVVYMRDFAFYDYRSAARFQRHVIETELAPVAQLQFGVVS